MQMVHTKCPYSNVIPLLATFLMKEKTSFKYSLYL